MSIWNSRNVPRIYVSEFPIPWEGSTMYENGTNMVLDHEDSGITETGAHYVTRYYLLEATQQPVIMYRREDHLGDATPLEDN